MGCMVMYRNILDYFSDTVNKKAGETAVIHNNDSITFEELDRKSRFLAIELLKLQKQSVIVPVAVFLPKSIGVVIADIAACYSGNFFSNLDVKTPANRISNILEVMKPGVIVTDEKCGRMLSTLEDLNIPVVYIDKIEWSEGETIKHNKALDKMVKERIDTDPFCIINTSGSTGTPKGVLLTHRGFIDYVNWAVDTFKFDGSEIMGVMSAIVFDHYVYETCLMMVKGATMVLLDMTLASFPAKLLMEVNEKKVNYIFWVPTVMVNIANRGLLEKIKIEYLKMVWFAGEVFPTKQFNMWRKCYPEATFVNLYGPCEITVDCTYHILSGAVPEDESLPIGIPCKNVDVFLLDENDRLCADGEVGELCVRGTSLAQGYYNNPEKTAQVFVQNPLNASYPELIYRTGDLAYKNSEGVFIFKGRRDNLVKHMGNRVDMGEIEHIVVNKLRMVKNCCVTYDFTKNEIVLVYEMTEGFTEVDLRKGLAAEFPRYMIPTRYIAMDELPRNTNGKIDRNLLKQQVNE